MNTVNSIIREKIITDIKKIRTKNKKYKKIACVIIIMIKHHHLS